VEDITYSYLESNGSKSNVTTSLDQNRSIVREGTVEAESKKYEESFSDHNVQERAQPIETTNGGGTTIRRSGNTTLEGGPTINNTEQIVGGTATAFGSFPFFVHGANPNDDTKICGGVLVHPDIFLTAASCRTLFFEDSEVFIGATNLLSTLGFAESRKVLEKKAHPDYDFVSRANDLMLIKLDSASTQTPADFNRVADFPATGENLVVVGFGWTNVDEEVLSQSLQQATITVADFARCEATNNAAVSTETQICAGQATGGPDSW
jgi:secreted trypsin-like serine protease